MLRILGWRAGSGSRIEGLGLRVSQLGSGAWDMGSGCRIGVEGWLRRSRVKVPSNKSSAFSLTLLRLRLLPCCFSVDTSKSVEYQALCVLSGSFLFVQFLVIEDEPHLVTLGCGSRLHPIFYLLKGPFTLNPI